MTARILAAVLLLSACMEEARPVAAAVKISPGGDGDGADSWAITHTVTLPANQPRYIVIQPDGDGCDASSDCVPPVTLADLDTPMVRMEKMCLDAASELAARVADCSDDLAAAITLAQKAMRGWERCTAAREARP